MITDLPLSGIPRTVGAGTAVYQRNLFKSTAAGVVTRPLAAYAEIQLLGILVSVHTYQLPRLAVHGEREHEGAVV